MDVLPSRARRSCTLVARALTGRSAAATLARMNSPRLLGLSVLLAGCAGATPGPAVGASPSEVQVVAVASPADAKPAPEKTSAGDDTPKSAEGKLIGPHVGEAIGVGGIGLAGTGIGVGGTGTLGPSVAGGTGQGFGSSDSHARVPQVKMGATSVSGRLPPEVIQRIVRQSFGRFRLCYETGLQKEPKLGGKLTAHFVIDKTGAVTSITNGGSDLNDAQLEACVLRSFSTLAFPAPEGGIVVVDFPIIFVPAEPAPAPPPAKPSP
jgi:hypothetical protein